MQSKTVPRVTDDGDERKNNPSCPFCGSKSEIDSSPAPLKNPQQARTFLKRRYYRCTSAFKHKFSTDEKLSHGKPLLVQKSDDQVVPFEFDKLLESMRMAGSPKDPNSVLVKLAEEITRLSYAAASTTMPNVTGRVIGSRDIGRIALHALGKHKKTAMWVRYTLIFKSLDSESTTMDQILQTLRTDWNGAK